MSTPVSSVQGGDITGIAPGTVIGGRFVVERLTRRDPLGEVLLARDDKTGKPIAIRLLAPELSSDVALSTAVRDDVKAAARAKHRALVSTYGVGTHGGLLFIASEWAQGSPLSELAAERAGAPLSLRGAYNVIAHVCKALTELHAVSAHGALRPGVVLITKSGRVKITDLGLGRALLRCGHAQVLSAADQAFLAPEVRTGQPPTPASDIFGVGGLLYVLLTGRSPAEAFIPPSQAHPDGNQELDQLLLRCLAGDPAQRFATAQDIVHALLPLAASAPEAPAGELGVEVEVDVDIAMSIAPPAPARASTPALVIPHAQAHADDGGLDVRVSIDPGPPSVAPAVAPATPARPRPPQAFKQGPLAQPPAQPPVVVQQAPARPAHAHAQSAPQAPPAAAGVDFGNLMAKLTENDAPRWMVSKSGLDHGPFTARELIKHIVEGDFTESDVLFNMSNEERKPLAEWTDLHPFIEQYRLRKAETDHAVALQKSTTIERRSNVAKALIFAGSLAVVLVAGGGYLMSRQAAQKRQAASDVDLAAMFESGQVKIKGTAGILQHVGRKSGGPKKPGSAPSAGPGGFASYEDAMNQAVSLGDATRGGGERQLTSADVQGVMDRKLNALFSCVSEELRRGGRLGSVRIDLAIMGSGQVAGASVNTGSPAFKSCIAGKVRAIKFPDFPAPRMGARYAFDVN